MSLDNIQLPAIVIQDLFKKSLIDSKNERINSDFSNSNNITFLGENKKKITLLIADKNELFLATDELNFLIEILTACKLTLQDVAMVNLAKNNGITYESIQNQLQAGVTIAFGVSTNDISLPLAFPQYQIQQYNGIRYLFAPTLDLIKNKKAEKKTLWACLQQLFLT